MNVEIELLEQIVEEPVGWELQHTCAWLRGLRKEPFVVLRGLWNGGHLQFVDAMGASLPRYRCEEILRAQDEGVDCYVAVTDEGASFVYG